jgi:hypothetical protein
MVGKFAAKISAAPFPLIVCIIIVGLLDKDFSVAPHHLVTPTKNKSPSKFKQLNQLSRHRTF